MKPLDSNYRLLRPLDYSYSCWLLYDIIPEAKAPEAKAPGPAIDQAGELLEVGGGGLRSRGLLGVLWGVGECGTLS